MGKKYLDTKKNSLEEAVQKIWNGDTITEAPDDLEYVVLDFDKMSEFKKARNYLDKNGIRPPGYGGGGGAEYWKGSIFKKVENGEIADFGQKVLKEINNYKLTN